MAVSFYLSRKKRIMTRFSPACRGKGDHGNVACTCDSLFPLPGEEKAIMGAWQGCLGACYGLSPLPVKQKAISRLPWKALGIFGGSARDGLFPTGCPRKDNLIASTEGPWTPRRKSAGVLAMAFSPCPSREMLFQVSTRRGQDASQKCLGSSRPEITLIVNKCTLRLLLFGTGSNTCISAPGPGMPPEDPRGSRKPSEGPGSLRWECSRWPLPSACRGKGNFKVPPAGSESHRWECSR